MLIGRLVVALGLADEEELKRALAEQRRTGRRLRDILLGMRDMPVEALAALMDGLPSAPRTPEELGINRAMAREIFLKSASYSVIYDTASVADELRVSSRLAGALIEEARQQKLIEFRPRLTGGEPTFALSAEGRAQAEIAFANNGYVGPLPVSLEAYAARIRAQSVRNERVTQEKVASVFTDLVLSGERLLDIGAAANSSKSALLYGPPGNGKTAMAERMGRLFGSFVFIPHCFEVAGQIVQVFDGSVHQPILDDGPGSVPHNAGGIVAEEYDRRWVPCRRPFVFAGGELTAEMLELNFNPITKYYEAPLQVKATNGVFLIDDFGRQIIQPRVLLNRWIVPMDRNVDYLKLITGKSFSLPFDQLLLFSTNIEPEELMDPTFLRRISHKIPVGAPTEEEFRSIMRRAMAESGVTLEEATVQEIIARINASGARIASFMPTFILDQIRDLRAFAGQVSERVAVDFALRNLLSGVGKGPATQRVAIHAQSE